MDRSFFRKHCSTCLTIENTETFGKAFRSQRDGKVRLRDGRTGEYFDSPVTIGHMHYLKLHHLVMIRSMRVLQVYSSLLRSSRSVVKHSSADSVSEMEV